MNELIVGYGEIGKAVKEAFCPTALTYDNGDASQSPLPSGPYDVMHICFPYSDSFIEHARFYISTYQPRHIAVWSTLKIGTAKLLGNNVVHTPTEGKHPKLADSMRVMPRWVGYNDQSEADFFATYFESKDTKVRIVENTDYTEALKLLSTTEYGVNLVYADYKKRVADSIGMDYDLCMLWNGDYNHLYQQLGMPQFQKFVLTPPNGVCGGHCVRENSILLSEQYPDTMLERINAMKKPGENQ